MTKLLSKPIIWPRVVLIKEKYNLTYEEMGKLLQISPSTISGWVNSQKSCRTNIKTYNKFYFLHKHFNSKYKWFIKFWVRFIK